MLFVGPVVLKVEMTSLFYLTNLKKIKSLYVFSQFSMFYNSFKLLLTFVFNKRYSWRFYPPSLPSHNCQNNKNRRRDKIKHFRKHSLLKIRSDCFLIDRMLTPIPQPCVRVNILFITARYLWYRRGDTNAGKLGAGKWGHQFLSRVYTPVIYCSAVWQVIDAR